MKRILAPLLLLPAFVFAAVPVPGGYAGGQVGISFAGPRTFVQAGTPSTDDPVVLVDDYVGGDYVAKVNTAGLWPIYDAGSPVLVTALRIKGYPEGNQSFSEQVCTGRMGLFSVYASNDKEDWTLCWQGRGETLSTAFETWQVRNAATGAMTVYTNSVVANVYDDSDKPFSTPYRYYRVEASPSSSIPYSGHRAINVSEFSLWTESLSVTAHRPRPFAGNTALNSSDAKLNTDDDADGVAFSGVLACAPAGSADIHVCVADADYGADYAAWQAAGRDFVLARGVASGSAFSARLPLPKGVRTTRIFAVSGDAVAPAQIAYRVAVGTEAAYPPCHQSGFGSSGKANYDASFANYCDWPQGYPAVWIFDCTELGEFYPASIRFWRRRSTLHVEYMRPRSAVVSVTDDDIAWPDDETDLSDASRAFFYRSAEEATDANWRQVEDLSWTQTDVTPSCYDVAIPPELGRRAKYVKITNIGFAAASEFEIRILRREGTLVLVK